MGCPDCYVGCHCFCPRPSVAAPRLLTTEARNRRRPVVPKTPARLSTRRPEHQAIILAVFAGMFAWVMQAALDYYFYAGRTYPEHLFLNIPARELFSRLAILSAFLLAGFITSRMVRSLEHANARARRLDDCVRTVRSVNQLITRERDRTQLAEQACRALVRGLGYDRVEINLGNRTVAEAESRERPAAEADGSCAAFPICCADEILGELVVSISGKSEPDRDEQALLNEVSEDIGFAVRSIELGESLEQQREELQTILDSVPAYITYKDASGRYLRVNRAVSDLAGVPADRWVNRRLPEILPGASPEGRAIDAQVIDSGQPRRTAIGTLDFAPGKRWVQTDRIPYRDGSGETAGVITLSYDITDLMQAQRDLAIKEEQLRQSQKMEAIGHLAGGIAHDFNNLLTAISGYAELARTRVRNDGDTADMLGSIVSASAKAAALTQQLLAFGRRQPLRLERQDLSAIVLGMSELLERLLGENISFRTDLGTDLGKVEVDPTQIEQVVLNLAVNARDAMPNGGDLTIRTRVVTFDGERVGPRNEPFEGDFVCLSVIDTGEGIDQETMSRIYEPFFTTKEPGVGTGLGLAVVFGVVDQHDGLEEARSEPGKGTTFDVYLPVAPIEEEVTTVVRPGTSEATGSGGGERVLVVEDADVVRSLAVRALEQSGYEVVQAASAEEAMEIVENDRRGFELVFSDIVLPGKSGVELAEEIAAAHPDWRMLLASGYPGRTSGPNDPYENGFPFLAKPYSVRGLVRKVRNVLC